MRCANQVLYRYTEGTRVCTSLPRLCACMPSCACASSNLRKLNNSVGARTSSWRARTQPGRDLYRLCRVRQCGHNCPAATSWCVMCMPSPSHLVVQICRSVQGHAARVNLRYHSSREAWHSPCALYISHDRAHDPDAGLFGAPRVDLRTRPQVRHSPVS